MKKRGNRVAASAGDTCHAFNLVVPIEVSADPTPFGLTYGDQIEATIHERKYFRPASAWMVIDPDNPDGWAAAFPTEAAAKGFVRLLRRDTDDRYHEDWERE